MSVIPVVKGDDGEEMFDDCMYDKANRINTLLKTAGEIVIPNEIQTNKRELTKEEQDRKAKIRKGKLWKKSHSVMPAAGILKK